MTETVKVIGVWPSAKRYKVQNARLNYNVKSQTIFKNVKKETPSNEPTAKIS